MNKQSLENQILHSMFYKRNTRNGIVVDPAYISAVNDLVNNGVCKNNAFLIDFGLCNNFVSYDYEPCSEDGSAYDIKFNREKAIASPHFQNKLADKINDLKKEREGALYSIECFQRKIAKIDEALEVYKEKHHGNF